MNNQLTPMKKLRTLAVTFDTQLQPWEIPRFRGAVAHKVGLEHDWFHNHNNATGGVYQRYPLIQYKIETSKTAMRPMLLCIEQGVEEAHHFFSQPDWGMSIGGRQHDMRIHKLNVHQHTLQLWDHTFKYRIHKWMAFNPDNWAVYNNLRGIAAQYHYMEQVLTSHILSFASGCDWHIEPQFQVVITNLIKEEWVEYNEVKVKAYTLEFECPLSLPDFVGLGKGVSVGFGVVRRQGRT
jgi:hypothetical protein